MLKIRVENTDKSIRATADKVVVEVANAKGFARSDIHPFFQLARCDLKYAEHRVLSKRINSVRDHDVDKDFVHKLVAHYEAFGVEHPVFGYRLAFISESPQLQVTLAGGH